MMLIHSQIAGDGRLGYQPGSPYNAIHVGAATPEIPTAVRAE